MQLTADRGGKEQLLKLLFTCLLSIPNARLPLGTDKILSRKCSFNFLASLKVLFNPFFGSMSDSLVRGEGFRRKFLWVSTLHLQP